MKRTVASRQKYPTHPDGNIMLPHDTSMTNAAAQFKLDAIAAAPLPHCCVRAPDHQRLRCARFRVVTPLTWATLAAAHQILRAAPRIRLRGLDHGRLEQRHGAGRGVLAEDYYAQEARARQIREASEVRKAG